MGNRLRQKVRPMSIRLLLWTIAVLVSLNVLTRFTELNLTAFQPDVITLVAVLFLLLEVGIFGKGGMKKGAPALLVGVIGVLALTGIILGWFGITVGFLEASQGFVDVGVLIAIVYEIFN